MKDNRLLSRHFKPISLVAGACAVALALTVTGATSSVAAAKPLVIGVSLSLTGDFADPGNAVKKGYQLWVTHINAKGGILGRKVTLKIVDDLSSPTQVVTNYTNLITRDKVDLVVGPFSSLLTVPASQVANRYKYAFIESAGGGPKVFAQNLTNLFFVQPGPIVKQGDVFADYILSLPAAQRPKTAAYPSLDDPFAQPVADTVRVRFEKAGITTVYNDIYPAETPDLTPIMAKVVAAKPDVIVSGTQSLDAYQQVKALIQLKYNPKFLYMSNGANSPSEFPSKVGAANVNGIFSSGDWFTTSTAPGSQTFVKEYIAKFGGTAALIDNSSAEAYAAGQLIELIAQRTGKIDNATIIKSLHAGTWPTLLGTLSWDKYGVPQSQYLLVQWQNGALKSVFPTAVAQAKPLLVKPGWAG